MNKMIDSLITCISSLFNFVLSNDVQNLSLSKHLICRYVNGKLYFLLNYLTIELYH